MKVSRQNFETELLLIVILFTLNAVYCNNCVFKETCGQCIQDLNCFWCTLNNTNPHCLPTASLNLCSQGNTENPSGNRTENSTAPLLTGIKRVNLRLRRNQKYTIKFWHLQRENYPVDLYYIMDLSYSMFKFKNIIATLGIDLAKEMGKKTNDFFIGFGSFVDKHSYPFTDTVPEYFKDNGYETTYSFKNHLPLQRNSSLFNSKVGKTRISANRDTPEGGFDAIMQAIVCGDKIGWRKGARHLLVMSTDEESHIAGDGKLAGIIEPNDAKCHMKGDSYTQGLVYDYPSMSQINYVARQNNVNLIFAVVKGQRWELVESHYKSMSNIIENLKVGIVEENSSNVVKFISEIYDGIRENVKISSTATKDVSVNIASTCTNFKDGVCSDVKPGEQIDYEVTIEPLTCHENAEFNNQTIQIKIEGLDVGLIVDLEVICDCECAKKRTRDPKCTNHGDLECGICRCDEDRLGHNCQCESSTSVTTNSNYCVKPDDQNEIVCSGRGDCICGKCNCRKKPDKEEFFYGKYCECDSFSCPLKCSGHGKCECGECKCYEGWGGAACDCFKETSQCFEPGGREECSGNGKCVCGSCQCNETYTGTYCEIQDIKCAGCDHLNSYVKCQMDEYKHCTKLCNNVNLIIVEKLDENQTDVETRECNFVVDNNCQIRFEYFEENNNLTVIVQKQKICGIPLPLIATVSGGVLLVLVIGIVTLIAWKAVTMIHDKREYAKFISERNETNWSTGENPLYKPVTSHFQNPIYQRASQRISTMFGAMKSNKQPDVTMRFSNLK